MTETIETAAIQMRDGTVHTLPRPNRHHNIIHAHAAETLPSGILSCRPHSQGFVTSAGRYVERIEAAKLALESGQIEHLQWPPNLFSEDLW